MIGSILLAAILGLAALCMLGLGLAAVIQAIRHRPGRSNVVREVIRTDSRMLGDAFRLSVAHFHAITEMRKLGGRR